MSRVSRLYYRMCGKIFRKFMVVRPHSRGLKERRTYHHDQGPR
jgi:hypothetical protein